MGSVAECEAQEARDAEYTEAWENAPKSFKNRAASAGIDAQVDPLIAPGVLEYDEHLSRVNNPGHTPSFVVPDMSALDTQIDRLIEKHGVANEPLIRAVVEDLKVPMLEEIEKNRALMLGKVLMNLIKHESHNILARCHQLLHAIPRLAVEVGFGSMRKSSVACGVSPEWIRRGRDKACEQLGIPIPVEGRKTEKAKESYRTNGLNNHWRKQKFKPKLIQPKRPCLLKPKQIRMTPQLAAA